MDEYISKEKAIKELREVYENEYPTASGDFDEYASHDVPNVLRNIPSANVISRTEVLELIESFKVESTHELSKSDFDRNDTLRLLQDVIRGLTWKDVL